MDTPVKSAVESALVALLVAGACLWFMITGANAEEVAVGRVVLLALGLACALVAHWVFMGAVLKRSGRTLMPWMLAIVLTVPLGTAALLAVLASEDKPREPAKG